MYSKNEDEIFKILNSNIDGLDSKETKKRINDYGQNIIINKKKMPWILRFLKQFNDTMIIILLVVALLLYFYGYFYSHEYTDTIVILFVVFINAIVGFIQEEKATLVLRDLKKYETSTCKVKRDDKIIVINTKELVPGDIIYLESGETIRADIIIVSQEGNAIKFNEQDVRPMGRTASGVKSMNLRENDIAVCMDIAVDDEELLVISENGYGKRTPVSEYKRQNRGGVGLITYKISEKTGKVVGAIVCKNDDELMLINTSGIAIRINVSDISVTSRSAMGVRLMRTSEEEKVVAIAKIAKTGDEEKDEQLSLEACADNEVVEANKDTSLDRLVEESQKEETEE